MSQQFVDIDNARYDDQRQVMQQIIDAGHCPFCADNLFKYHQQPVLKETDHWLLTKNQWPYEHTRLHLLVILKTHVERLQDLTPAMGADLFKLLAWAEKEFKVPGGGFAIRFGDTNYSAGSVNHIHAQFIVPSIDDPDFAPTRFKIGKDKDRRRS